MWNPVMGLARSVWRAVSWLTTRKGPHRNGDVNKSWSTSRHQNDHQHQQHYQKNPDYVYDYIYQLKNVHTTFVTWFTVIFWNANLQNLPSLRSKEVIKTNLKIQTCWDFLSINSDNEQSYQSVPSICMNSFTSMGAAPLLPADKRQHINTNAQFWYEKQ